MSVFVYILFAAAMAMYVLVVLRGCAEVSPIKLTRGIAVSFAVALVYCLMMAIGVKVGSLLIFKDPDPDMAEKMHQVNNMVFIGLNVVVAIRLMLLAFRKDRDSNSFDISRWSTVAALSLATGINLLLIGLAMGFKVSLRPEAVKMLLPMLLMVFLFSYLAIMMGRQKMKMKSRRWLIIAVVFLLIATLKCSMDY